MRLNGTERRPRIPFLRGNLDAYLPYKMICGAQLVEKSVCCPTRTNLQFKYQFADHGGMEDRDGPHVISERKNLECERTLALSPTARCLQHAL